jgi:hypothetical protein
MKMMSDNDPSIFDVWILEVGGCGKGPRDKELRDLYASPNIIRGNKSRKVRWAEHVACTGEMKNAYNIFVTKP